MYEYRSKYECATCGNKVSARHDYCSACNARFTKDYGTEWYRLEWAQYAIRNQREQARLDELNYVMLDADNRFCRPAIVNIDTLTIEADHLGKYITDVEQNYYTLSDARRVGGFDTFIAQQYRNNQCGYRTIYRRLIAKYGVDKTPSLSTIKRRVNALRL